MTPVENLTPLERELLELLRKIRSNGTRLRWDIRKEVRDILDREDGKAAGPTPADPVIKLPDGRAYNTQTGEFEA